MEQSLKDKNAEAKHAEMQQAADCAGADFYSCEEAVKRLNEYLDHEMTAEERVVVIKHLEICRSCLKHFSFEQTLVISLRQKASLVCMPAALRERLFLLLRDEE